mgnify:CR=1 FL=1
MFMGKKRKAVMLGVNVFLVLALLWSVVFTVDRKNAAYTNTDIERYKSLELSRTAEQLRSSFHCTMKNYMA